MVGFDGSDRRRESARQLRRAVDSRYIALHDVSEGCDVNTDTLQNAVADVAIAARANGVSPERLLVIIKRTLKQDALDHVTRWWRNVLANHVVRWGIETYLGPPGAL